MKLKIAINIILARCILYCFQKIFIINVGIGTYFVYYKYVNCNKRNVSKYYDMYITHNIKWE